jgi:hypothetical protein
MDLGELTRSLKSIKFGYIVLAFSLELAAFLVWAQKWKFIVDKFEKVKFTTIFLCHGPDQQQLCVFPARYVLNALCISVLEYPVVVIAHYGGDSPYCVPHDTCCVLLKA